MNNNNNYSVKIINVTPEMAQAFINSNKRNRKISEHRVTKYAKDMERGMWSPATMLIVDEDGSMVDANHRMMAVIKSGRTVPMVIFKGLEKKYIPMIDTGRPRTAGDMLAFLEEMDGISSLRNKSVIVRWILRYKHNAISETKGFTDIGYDDIANFMLENKDGVEQAMKDFSSIRSMAVLSAGAAMFLIRDGNKEHKNRVDDFIRRIAEGENIKKGDPEFAAREALYRITAESGSQRSIKTFYAIVYAWNAVVDNTPIRLIRTPKDFSIKENGTPFIRIKNI